MTITHTHDFPAGRVLTNWTRKMTRKLSKEEIKDKFDGDELDLSLCNLAKVPVREMVGIFSVRSKIVSVKKKKNVISDRVFNVVDVFYDRSEFPSSFSFPRMHDKALSCIKLGLLSTVLMAIRRTKGS